jgi:hypothetical protein
MKRFFREKIKRAGKRGRCSLEVWPDLPIGTVIKHTVNKHLKEVIRPHELWKPRTSDEASGDLKWWHHAQYLMYRALQWDTP